MAVDEPVTLTVHDFEYIRLALELLLGRQMEPDSLRQRLQLVKDKVDYAYRELGPEGLQIKRPG